MKTSLIGYSCNSGLGELNRQIASYCDFIDKWLIWPHTKLGYQIDESVRPEIKTQIVDHLPSVDQLDWLLDTDVLLFFETPLYPSIVKRAKDLGKIVVCIPMLEWTPLKDDPNSWSNHVDLFICPTLQCYERLSLEGYPCKHFSWPHDTDRFQFALRETCTRFLFIEGNGGFKGRKGGEAIKESLRLWPQMPLTVITQKHHHNWPDLPELKVVSSGETNLDIYSHGDVLLYPATCDGIGLQPFEARSSGMPVIVNRDSPWMENFCLSSLLSIRELKEIKSGRWMDWHKTKPEKIVDICKSLLHTSISSFSKISRQKAEESSWSNRITNFKSLLMEANS